MASPYPAIPTSSPRIPIPSSAQASSLTPSQTLLDRTSRFIEKNRNLLLIGATVAVSAGAGYYLYNRSSPSDEHDPEGDSEKAGGSGGVSASGKNKKKKKGKKSNGKYLKGEGLEGPLLEEVQPEQGTSGQEKSVPTKKEEKKENDPLADVPDSTALAGMSETARNELGASLKNRGNELYKDKHFQKAVACYTKAIEVSIKRDPVFFSNRAACFGNYDPPEWSNVVDDCDEALKLDKTYGKALKRRAGAYERLGKDEEAVRDFTALVVISGFDDAEATASVERCVKRLAGVKAKEQLESREPKLPSPTFIASYFAAFRPHSKPSLPEEPSQGDQTLSLAFDALAAADYTHALSFVNEAIEQGITGNQGQAEAYNLRGTFRFLMNEAEESKKDFEKSLDLVPDFVQSLVKIASVHMELQDPTSAFGDFETAIRYNPNDPDIYYHRGQVYFIMQDYERAIADYVKSTELDGNFVFSQVQHAVALYKQEHIASCMAAFRRIMKQFPDRCEPPNYYGEILLDQGKFAEAVERFDRSIELDMNNKPRTLLPLINKATTLFAWKSDFAGAENLCQEALAIDPQCDLAVALLAQLTLQQGRTEEAVNWFAKSAELMRSEAEIINAITYQYAAKAQQEFLKNYPEYAERLSLPMPQQG